MNEMTLQEFMRQRGLSQKAAGELLGRTQGGIGFILRDTQKGNREMRIVLDDSGAPIEAVVIKRIPLRAAVLPAAA